MADDIVDLPGFAALLAEINDRRHVLLRITENERRATIAKFERLPPTARKLLEIKISEDPDLVMEKFARNVERYFATGHLTYGTPRSRSRVDHPEYTRQDYYDLYFALRHPLLEDSLYTYTRATPSRAQVSASASASRKRGRTPVSASASASRSDEATSAYTHVYNGRNYKVQQGTRGGLYIIANGRRIYLPTPRPAGGI